MDYVASSKQSIENVNKYYNGSDMVRHQLLLFTSLRIRQYFSIDLLEILRSEFEYYQNQCHNLENQRNKSKQIKTR